MKMPPAARRGYAPLLDLLRQAEGLDHILIGKGAGRADVGTTAGRRQGRDGWWVEGRPGRFKTLFFVPAGDGGNGKLRLAPSPAPMTVPSSATEVFRRGRCSE